MLILGYFVPPFTGLAQKVHDFHFLGLVFGALMLFQFIMSKAKPLPQDWEHTHSGDVDLTPWKYAKPVGIGIVVFVLVLYFSMADFSVLA